VVNEARELRQTHGKRLLTTLETGTLAATRTGKLTLGTAASGGAMAGAIAATDALTRLCGALRGAKIVELHLFDS
jgi:hypothetical protein